MKAGRNDPCPCGSGRKYKKCCLQNSPEESSPPPKFRFEPGSYGGNGGFMPSIACLKQKTLNSWEYHFVLAKLNEVHFQEDEASAQAKTDLEAAFIQREHSGSDYAMAEYLKTQGYISVTGFNIVNENIGKFQH